MSEEKTLGELLRGERDRRGESLEQVHERTGVGVRVLASLEEGTAGVVEPVYLRLALTSYAEYLGLAADGMLEHFDRDHGDLPDTAAGQESSLAPAPPWWDDLAHRLHRIPRTWIGGFLAILLLAAILGIVYLRGGDAGERAPVSATRPPARRAASAPDRVLDAAAPAAPASSPVATDAPRDSAASPARGDVGLAPADTEPSPASAEPPSAPSPERLVADATPPRVTPTDMVPAAAPAAAPVSPAPDTLVLLRGDLDALAAGTAIVVEGLAVDSTWIQVQWDGTATSEEIIPRGQRRRWAGRESVLVRAGRAHGIRFSYQGRLLGNGRLGDPTKVLRFRASEDGVVLLGPDLEPLSRVYPTPQSAVPDSAAVGTTATESDVAGP